MVAYKSLKTKKKSCWVLPKVVVVTYGSGPQRELFITEFKLQFKWGFAKVVVTRAGRLQEWCKESFDCITCRCLESGLKQFSSIALLSVRP